MRLEWYGQSAFRLEGAQGTVFIDPFGDVSAAAAGRGLQFEYPPITGVRADLLLITHEHFDHNAADVIDGSPEILRSTAGRLSWRVGEVLAVASEHDDAAGTERGPNTIFAFDLDGVRVVHMGDFGQSGLRSAQAAALADVELLIVPVGGGPTIDAEQAALVVEMLDPRWVVPMHYRTARTNFLEPVDAFLERFDSVVRLSAPSFETSELTERPRPTIVVPAAP
jgi:L-ascorbate metabolism protein UlaG (beta-lactamase superfamily)